MKKALKKIKDVFVGILSTVAILVAVLTVFSVLTFNRTDRNLFGFKFYICLSDSMKATDFAAGDLVVSKAVDVSTLKEGDVISFVSTDRNSNGQVITHKIREVRPNGNLFQFITYGTTTGDNDATPVEGYNVLGKYVFSVPKVGSFFNFVKTTPGYICCIFVPFMFLIIVQIVNTIQIFRAYKKEEQDQLKAEKEEFEKQKLAELEKLKAEKEKLEKKQQEEREQMMRELAELKAQMSGISQKSKSKDEDSEE